MPMPCKLCCHRERKAIEMAFASAMTDREIGRRFGVSHMAASRHRKNHLVAPTAAVAAAANIAAKIGRRFGERTVASAINADASATNIAVSEPDADLAAEVAINDANIRAIDAEIATYDAGVAANERTSQARANPTADAVAAQGAQTDPARVADPARRALRRIEQNAVTGGGQINLDRQTEN